MGVSEKIKLLLSRRKMTVTKLAEELGISRQYLTKKFKNEDFTYCELMAIADILNCGFDVSFIDKKNKDERI